MHLIRRAAFRAASSPSTTFISKPRSLTTASPFLLRSKVQTGISSSVFRRFNSNSDEANSSEEKRVESADGEDSGSVQSAIESATETASSYISDAAASLTNNLEQAKESIYDGAAAATGFPARQDHHSRNNDRGERKPYDRGDRGERGMRPGRPPMDRLTPTTGVYVGNLLFEVTAADLTKEFEPFGTIKSVTIATDIRGLSKGFGYVEFETTEEATNAKEAKNQAVLEGRRMIVNYMAKTKRDNTPNTPSKTLFIGNLAFEMSDADLNTLFRDIRNVIDVRVAIDRRTGQPRGFAHADFVDVASATRGFEILSGKEIYGRKLRVDYSSANRADSSSSFAGNRGGARERDGGDRGESRENY